MIFSLFENWTNVSLIDTITGCMRIWRLACYQSATNGIN